LSAVKESTKEKINNINQMLMDLKASQDNSNIEEKMTDITGLDSVDIMNSILEK